MTKRFQFMLLGAVLTLVIVGSLAFAFSWTQASSDKGKIVEKIV